MGLITIYAKVRLMTEEDFESLEESEKLGTIPPSSKWVWRNIVIHTDDIKRLIQYNSSKTIIQGYNGDMLFVKEKFEDLYVKWDENRNDKKEEDVWEEEYEDGDDEETPENDDVDGEENE